MAERIDITELDFDDIKDNLKVFLKGQTEFTDYDFEGSTSSYLLDVLAYNTYYAAFNANMAYIPPQPSWHRNPNPSTSVAQYDDMVIEE